VLIKIEIKEHTRGNVDGNLLLGVGADGDNVRAELGDEDALVGRHQSLVDGKRAVKLGLLANSL
jgi:hypothetical protein